MTYQSHERCTLRNPISLLRIANAKSILYYVHKLTLKVLYR